MEALRISAPTAHEIIYVGSSDGFERPLLQQSGVTFDHYYEVAAGPLNGVGVLRALLSLLKIALGIVQSLRIVLRHRPQALLLTGGWANVPLALAAGLLRVPMLVYLPDVEPGRTIQFLARIARRIAITVPESAAYFKDGQTVVTGYPLRQHVLEASRAAAVKHFGLDASRCTLLVFGGSRGAHSINQALLRVLPMLLEDGIQVIHVTGTLGWEGSQATQTLHPQYHPFAYLHRDMGLALAAADLVVCRAGASILGELTHFGLAGVLVPYPYAWRYQKTNADWLAERGAAIRLDDADMAAQLLPTLRRLLQDTVQLETMQTKARSLARDGAQALADELAAMADDKA